MYMLYKYVHLTSYRTLPVYMCQYVLEFSDSDDDNVIAVH